MADEEMEKIVERIKAEDKILNVYVEGRTPRCCKCDIKGHIRADCLPPLVKNKEGEERGEVNGAPLLVEVEETESRVAPQMRTYSSVEEEETVSEWKRAGREKKSRRKAHVVKDNPRPEPIQTATPTHISFTSITPCRHRPTSRPTRQENIHKHTRATNFLTLALE